MSSRRKSSTPCMIRVQEEVTVDDAAEMGISVEDMEEKAPSPLPPLSSQGFAVMSEDGEDLSRKEKGKEEEDVEEREAKAQRKQPGGCYECKYCPFSTQILNQFKEHVDSTHPNVILNPLYLCVICNFSTKKFDSLSDHNKTHHPDESNFKFKRIKLDNQTVLEQTIEAESISVIPVTMDTHDGEGFDPSPVSNSTTGSFCRDQTDNPHPLLEGRKIEVEFSDPLPNDQITAVSINGTIIIPDPMIHQGLSHVMPLLQRPPNISSAPKIPVPLNSTRYNRLLDNNATLITSFNRFPYPTHAELSWLTAASKHPEEQIKVWFTTQRLKQGITWSPEEVEEARKKMFNGSMPPTHQTFTDLPRRISQQDGTRQPAAQKMSNHLIGQSTTVSTSNGLSTTCTTVTVTTANQVSALKRTLVTHCGGQEMKRPMMSAAEEPKEKLSMVPPPVPPLEKLLMPLPHVPPDNKRALPAPVLQPSAPEMKKPIVAPLVAPKGKLPIAFPLSHPKDKLPMAPPLLLPKDRVSMTPIVSTDLKRTLISPESRSHSQAPSAALKDKLSLPQPLMTSDVKFPMAPPQVKRPPIIQTARAPAKAASLVPTFSLECKTQPSAEQKFTSAESRHSDHHSANGTPPGDIKNWFADHSISTHNGSKNVNNNFAPKEHPKTVPTQFPLLERVKGKTTEQLKILEESFQRNSFPTYNEVDHLVVTTSLSREEIDSWFMERRALRDNLEQALLNCMGSKKMDLAERRQQPQLYHGLLNGAHKPGGLAMSTTLCPIVAPTTSPVSLDHKSLALLKKVFVRTRWPSPEEYVQLEIQTGLARTDIVRWFKDSRLSLRSGALEWKELFQKLSGSGQNGHGGPVSAEHVSTMIQRCQRGKAPRTEDSNRTQECSRLRGQEIKDWFTNQLNQNMPDVSQNGAQNGGGREDRGKWLKEAERPRELISDTD